MTPNTIIICKIGKNKKQICKDKVETWTRASKTSVTFWEESELSNITSVTSRKKMFVYN